MISIEDRLKSDAAASSRVNERTIDDDWANVVQRADGRVRRQQVTMRVAVVVFLAVLGLAAVLSGTSDIESVDNPLDLAAPASEPGNADTGVRPSTLPAYLSIALTWGSSLVLGAIVFFSSTKSFRVPYLTERVGRVLATLSWVTYWNLIVAGITGVAITVIESSFASTVHADSGNAALFTFSLSVFLLLFTGNGPGLLSILAFGILAGGFRELVQNSGGTDLGLLATHLSLAVIIVAFSVVAYRFLNFHFDRSRLTRPQAGAFRWRQILGALLVVGGLATTIISVAPAQALNEQLSGSVPQIEGFESIVERHDALLFSPVPEVTIAYPPSEPFTGPRRVGDWARVLEVLVPERGPEPLITDPFDRAFTSQVREFALWDDRTDTPLVLTTRGDGSIQNLGFDVGVTIGPENRGRFERLSRIRDLGISVALVGALLWWSETGISRFTYGPRPWPRQPRRRELLGWAVYWSSAAAVVLAAVLPEFPDLPAAGPPALYPVYVVIALVFSYVGMRLVTPIRPKVEPGVTPPDDKILV